MLALLIELVALVILLLWLGFGVFAFFQRPELRSEFVNFVKKSAVAMRDYFDLGSKLRNR